MTKNIYKLTKIDIMRLVYSGVLTLDEAKSLIKTSHSRPPNTVSRIVTKIALNGPKTISLKSIQKDGGEDLGNPYHFLAELENRTTKSAFTYFVRRKGIPVRKHIVKKN